MALGRRKNEQQDSIWIATQDLPRSQGHALYEKLNQILSHCGFDSFAETCCAATYHQKLGRPSIPPGVYFRMLMIGYFEGIDSERGIAWRCADSLSLRSFLGYKLVDRTPDHSSLSRIRSRLDVEIHEEVFTWVLKALASAGLIDGKTIGVDGTTLEANAAMRSIVRRDTGQTYQAYLESLAKASGIETPRREDLAKLDKKRKNKGSNGDWEHPHDPDARITKMKDGRTHEAHKVEHAVDMKTGAVVGVTIAEANHGDTSTLPGTILEATRRLRAVSDDDRVGGRLHKDWMSEVVADKGYHSNEMLLMADEMSIRSYVSEPNRGHRNWKGKSAERKAVHANRRRIRGDRGKRLMKSRGEKIERSFAHAYETGGMRRTHLRGHQKIKKRLLIHLGALNLGLLMRTLFGYGSPRGGKGLLALFGMIRRRLQALVAMVIDLWTLGKAETAERKPIFSLRKIGEKRVFQRAASSLSVFGIGIE